MHILMMTNTFTPHVGGVARSVEAFTSEYRRRGHRVMVVAPEFENMPEDEEGVLRIPAIQRFNGSDFSVIIPLSRPLTAAVEAFGPDVVHSHHPFLLGGTALRLAARLEIPLAFTHHTMYERYTHYAPGDSKTLKRFVVTLSTSYANVCDQVFAPSESVAALLRKRGVTTPVDVVPTGVRLERFARGDGRGFRTAMAIPEDAIVVGHVGRLAEEKNLPFLTRAAIALLQREPRARFLVAGTGPQANAMRRAFRDARLDDRLHMTGVLDYPLLASAYMAMDTFAFASTSETQGMVVTEAMAAGVPVVALDAPGVREVVVDRRNGRLLDTDDPEVFAGALQSVAHLPADEATRLREHAIRTAEGFSLERTADRALALYERLQGERFVPHREAFAAWAGVARLIRTEWEVVRGMAEAAADVSEGIPELG